MTIIKAAATNDCPYQVNYVCLNRKPQTGKGWVSINKLL